jgi:crotonobetainyl-CoA:carnitine CoA-transferase CaiB-like acyl-CoA transferase
MSKTPVEVKRGPPRIGQHTREVLASAGMTEEEIATLAGIGAIRIDGESA